MRICDAYSSPPREQGPDGVPPRLWHGALVAVGLIRVSRADRTPALAGAAGYYCAQGLLAIHDLLMRSCTRTLIDPSPGPPAADHPLPEGEG